MAHPHTAIAKADVGLPVKVIMEMFEQNHCLQQSDMFPTKRKQAYFRGGA